MKKITLYVLALVLLTFVIPIFFTKVTVESKSFNVKDAKIQNDSDEQLNIYENVDKTPYDYKNYNTIKLLHTKTNMIEELPLDEYLYGVVSAEMPVDFDIEALKAQAIVARTYTIYKIMQNQSKHGEAYICDDSSCCQAWITKDDRMARWDADKKGGSGYPYLQTVETAGEEGYSQYSSEVELSKEEFVDKMKNVHSDFNINFDEEDCIHILEYTAGGRVKNVKIGNYNLSGVEVRSLFNLKSANFTVKIDNDKVKFEVIGYGHGVGMSQTGADSLAKQGYSCEDIVKHFYIGVEIIDF